MGITSIDPFTVITSGSHAETYTIQVARDGSLAFCNCTGFNFSKEPKHCKHTAEAIRLWHQHHEEDAQPMAMTPTTQRTTEPVSTALVPVDPDARALERVPVEVHLQTALIPSRSTLEAMVYLANALSKARGFAIPTAFDHSTKVFAVIYTGWELGVRPMVALRHMFVVDGKVSLDAQLTMGIVLARDPNAEFKWLYSEADGAKVELWRSGKLVSVGTFYKADAELAKLLTPKTGSRPGAWQLYPRDMYAWRAVQRACRLGAPELLNAIEPYGIHVEQAAGMMAAVEAPAAVKQVETTAPAGPMDTLEELPATGDDFTEPEDSSNTYAWFASLEMQRMGAGLEPEDFNIIVGPGEPEELYERIESWIFTDPEITDLGARTLQLVRETQAAKKAAAKP